MDVLKGFIAAIASCRCSQRARQTNWEGEHRNRGLAYGTVSFCDGSYPHIHNSQERRKVEEAYIQGLKKLAHKPLPDNQSELG